MKFSCLQQDLTSAIQIAQKIPHKNTSSPYSYIYIDTCQSYVRIVAAGPEQTIMTQLRADIYNEGKVLAPASLLKDIISKMPDVPVDIEVDERLLMTVRYMHMKYTIQCMPAASFSFTDDIEDTCRFKMKTSEFKKCIRRTYFTASLNTRPVLAGMLLKCDNGRLDFVTTDGSRASICTTSIDENISFEIIIPAGFVFDVTHSSDKYDDSLTVIAFNDKYVKIKTGNTCVITGLISGKFINYKSIIPHEASTIMTTDRSSFLSILERAYLLSDETLYTVKLEINYSKLLVSSASAAGNAFEEISVRTQGIPVTIAFNSKNFIEILRNTDYELLSFEFTTGTRICKITPVESGDLIYLISPIRI
mgnify:CR=1 FL=1